MGRFADALFKSRTGKANRDRVLLEEKQLKLNKKAAEQKAELDALKKEEMGLKLGALAEKFEARKRLARPDNSPTMNTPEGPPRPGQQDILSRFAQGQPDTRSDVFQAEAGAEIKQLQEIQAGPAAPKAQSKPGKQFSDEKTIPGFAEFMAKQPKPFDEDKFKRTNILGDDFRAETQENKRGVQAFQRLENIFQRKPDGTLDFDPVEAGAADGALIFGFMKVLEPGNRITQGDIAFAEDTAGQASKFTRAYNRIFLGEKLSPAARQNMLFQSGQAVTSSIANLREQVDRFTGKANRANVDPKDVVFDFVGDSESFVSGLSPTLTAGAKAVDKFLGLGKASPQTEERLAAIERLSKDTVNAIFRMDINSLIGLNPENLTEDESTVVEAAIAKKEREAAEQ